MAAALLSQAGVYVDRSKSGGHTNTTTQGGPIPLPASGLSVPAATLRIFVDHSLLEVRGWILSNDAKLWEFAPCMCAPK